MALGAEQAAGQKIQVILERKGNEKKKERRFSEKQQVHRRQGQL